MKILHTGDLHFQNDPSCLEETCRVSDFILSEAEEEKPDVIVLAGDVVDEFHSRIRIDSDAARAAIRFVRGCANIAPVIMVRGTKSHDRDTPYLFRELQARYPIHVSDKIEMVALTSWTGGDGTTQYGFDPLGNPDRNRVEAVFTCIPSLDKATLLANCEAMGIKEANAEGRAIFNDMFTALGEINAGIQNVPRIMIGHGMITGAQFSSGQTAIGEDLEYGVSDIRRGKFDLVAMGHVHKFQKFPGNIFYSGSPGRMNFGEQEEKGFLMVEFDGQEIREVRFIPTPARRFALYECDWNDGGLEAVMQKADACERECAGADVRFRYTVPEEEKHRIDRADLERRFTDAGARKVKIEAQILPVTRQRAAGISRLATLPEKISKWGDATGQEIPQRTLDIAAVIEGREVDELLADALAKVDEPQTTTIEGTEDVPATEAADVQSALNF